jgi:hypothetical protein
LIASSKSFNVNYDCRNKEDHCKNKKRKDREQKPEVILISHKAIAYANASKNDKKRAEYDILRIHEHSPICVQATGIAAGVEFIDRPPETAALLSLKVHDKN